MSATRNGRIVVAAEPPGWMISDEERLDQKDGGEGNAAGGIWRRRSTSRSCNSSRTAAAGGCRVQKDRVR